ncbi:hypothetical protein AVEN_50336-1 [Araneus ventricosus]|uniref:Uncharacterized protein n=1 Tax=Araneus ventricosus TaxID=182803 RepID=A0A4Y2E748_ARAVE|nr:hypothetical protein AVEN_50336-1 [Araneus ventricosus]
MAEVTNMNLKKKVFKFYPLVQVLTSSIKKKLINLMCPLAMIVYCSWLAVRFFLEGNTPERPPARKSTRHKLELSQISTPGDLGRFD